jgi:glycosyltransferase involved in cell wall biosynthesis
VTAGPGRGDVADVAVVVAARDATATIGAALDSIERAVAVAGAACTVEPTTEGGVQVVVIDGGSDDTTRDLVAARPWVRWLRQEGTGLAAARDQGIAATSAPLVAFCDADDAWTPDALRLRLDALAREPAAWAATGRVRFVARAPGPGADLGEEPGAAAADAPTLDAPTLDARRPRRRGGEEHAGMTPGALLVRRDTFARVGTFDPTLTIGADADWIVRAVQLLGQPVDVDAVVLEKGLRAGSLSTDVDTYRRELLTVARRLLTDQRRSRRG